MAGVTYTITGKTDRAVVSVTQDTDKIVDFVKNFVDAYNTLLDSLNDKLSEKKYSDYKPLVAYRSEDARGCLYPLENPQQNRAIAWPLFREMNME